MRYRALVIPLHEFVDAEYHLQNRIPFDRQGDKSPAWSWTVDFGDGIEVDVNIYNGTCNWEDGEYGPPWVDVILFEDGHEMYVCEPDDQLAGYWCLAHNSEIFTINVEPEVGRVAWSS